MEMTRERGGQHMEETGVNGRRIPSIANMLSTFRKNISKQNDLFSHLTLK